MPMDLEILRDALTVRARRAALAALVAFHPAHSQLRALQLADIRDGRLFCRSHRPLALRAEKLALGSTNVPRWRRPSIRTLISNTQRCASER